MRASVSVAFVLIDLARHASVNHRLPSLHLIWNGLSRLGAPCCLPLPPQTNWFGSFLFLSAQLKSRGNKHLCNCHLGNLTSWMFWIWNLFGVAKQLAQEMIFFIWPSKASGFLAMLMSDIYSRTFCVLVLPQWPPNFQWTCFVWHRLVEPRRSTASTLDALRLLESEAFVLWSHVNLVDFWTCVFCRLFCCGHMNMFAAFFRQFLVTI